MKSRGKKAKTDAATAAAPASKAKKGGEKKASAADEEAAKDQQEADEVDALADEPAENGSALPEQGAAPLHSSPSPPLPSPFFPFFFSLAPVYSRKPVVLTSPPRIAEAPNETGPNATPGGVVIDSSKVEAATVISQAA